MVLYCSVKGCGNNSNKKKKYQCTSLSFHAFPSNPELKQKWLLAIGRPSWNPPAYTRICSVHFSDDQIVHDRVRTRVMENACPDRALPLNSYFEASDIEVCRLCLATDLKLHSIEDGELNTCMESIIRFNENLKIEGLPQFVCYECAALLMKCHRLIEKSVVAQAILLDIFAQNGQITKSLVESQNREKLNLTSTLCHNIKPTTVYEFKHDIELSCSYYFETYSTEDCIAKEENFIKNDEDCMENSFEENEFVENESLFKTENDKNERKSEVEETDTLLIKQIDLASDSETNANSLHSENINSASESEMSIGEFENVEYLDENDGDKVKKPKGSKMERKKTVRKKVERKAENETRKPRKTRKTRVNGLTRKERSMLEYFDIKMITSLQEQISEWKKSMKHKGDENYKHKCEICTKSFANIDAYRIHAARHDPSRGSGECPVCKVRVRNTSSAMSHAHIVHGKKFHCKSCPKVFNSVHVALKHHKWHTGHRYECEHCPFSAAHVSGLYVHARKHARDVVCARCGHTFASRNGLLLHQARAHRGHMKTEASQDLRCEECDLSFETEGARRVHYLTGPQHKKATPFKLSSDARDPSLFTACRACGEHFPTRRELASHVREVHPRPGAKRYHMPSDRYPKQCEHCEITVEDRKGHWAHIRVQHPRERSSYQPVVTCVCETCGKGFQNATKLHIHELRHSNPSVQCEFCTKVFYDKFRLEEHMAAHGEARPFSCETCGRGFKYRSNLDCHRKVHSDAARYECSFCEKKFKYSTSLNLHVRSVHQKIPPPPRKKRTRAKGKAVGDQTE